MKNASVTKSATLVGLCMLVSTVASQAHDTRNCSDYGLKPVGLFVGGMPVETFVSKLRGEGLRLSDLMNLRKGESDDNFTFSDFLKILGLDGLDPKELAGLLDNININPGGSFAVPEALQGISGFTTTVLLQRILDAQGNLIAVDGQPISQKVVYGKIRDYIFIEGTDPSHLNVDVCTDDLLTGKRELYHWDVNVSSGGVLADPEHGFVVQQRVNDLLNPFPGVTLPAAAHDPTNKRGIWYRGLDHKLSAKGKKIEIANVYYRDLNAGVLGRFDSAHRLYKTTAQSCVDLFTHGHPPETFGELAGNDYCLGRCVFPPIVNSGE